MGSGGGVMRLLLLLLSFDLFCYGMEIYKSPRPSPNQVSYMKRITMGFEKSISVILPNLLAQQHLARSPNPSLALPPAPAPYTDLAPVPSAGSSSKAHHHHRRRTPHVPPVVPPSPSTDSGCSQSCVEPLTATPIGSPCGCVFPMKVKLVLDVPLYSLFPVVNELEIEIAAGTYLKQSQVKIMGAIADSQNQGRTIVEVNLVPLGDKFDNMTAALIHDRFLRKKVPLNITLYGTYDVMQISYPGFPSSGSSGGGIGIGPSGNAGDLPVTAEFSGKNQRLAHVTVILISLSAFVLFLICIGAIFVVLKWRKSGAPSRAVGPMFPSSITKTSGVGSILSNSMTSSPSLSLMSAMNTSMLSVKIFSLSELERATEHFSSKAILGVGGFGRVYHGVLEDGSEVAIKLLTRNNQSGDREFVAEVEMLSRLHHRNLVKLIGICTEHHRRCLVYELVRNGSVESHLHGVDRLRGPLDWDARLKIALGAARGLAYLHEDSNPRVIHRDFKAGNVLLEDDFTPKVSDFGLAREATEGTEHISTRVMGTFGYVAPEYAMTGHLLVKSDVYSYGVVLLELLSGRKPVDMSQPQGQENLVTWARPLLTTQEGLQALVDPSLEGKFNFDSMAGVASIASMCVHSEVSHRPFMGEVVQALKLIYDDKEDTYEADYCSRKESSAQESDSKGELFHSNSSWLDATPRLTYGQASSFITMEYCSGSMEEMGNNNRPFSSADFYGEGGVSSSVNQANRSGPLRTTRSKPSFYRSKGSKSDHARLVSRHSNWEDGYLT
uniref:Protein kinase domain-containing protein n=1 Tax=Kalanchoe fedtschenkoi TaxID=63787 RepID=A0A7N0U929_KALFE